MLMRARPPGGRGIYRKYLGTYGTGTKVSARFVGSGKVDEKVMMTAEDI
jgi:hypothetical protein